MKLICQLNDPIVLGQPGASDAPPRHAARAVLQNDQGLFALMYLEKFGLYSLPGGGVEDSEDTLTALRREILEETGCTCDEIREIGIVTENRGCHNFTQVNHYYAVHTHHLSAPALTDKERENRTRLQWHSFQELYRLVSQTRYATEQQKYIQARDVAALDAYLSL